MTNEQIIAELEAVRRDYRGIIANIAQRRSVLDRLERRTNVVIRRVTRVLRNIKQATEQQQDPADFWKNPQ